MFNRNQYHASLNQIIIKMTIINRFSKELTGDGFMRRKFLVIVAALALLLIPGKGNAQTARLDLKQSIQYALKANQTVRKAKLDVENSKYQIDEVKAGALPQISGSGSVTYNPLLQLS